VLLPVKTIVSEKLRVRALVLTLRISKRWVGEKIDRCNAEIILRTVSFSRNFSYATAKAAVSSNAIFSAKLEEEVSVFHPWNLGNTQPFT
jgi:hypothetical protein